MPTKNLGGVDPLNFKGPIVKPDGTPTAEFMRQWLAQRGTNTTTSEEIEQALTEAAEALLQAAAALVAANAAAALANALAATEVGGDGVDIEPLPAPLSDGNIALSLTDTGVAPGTYGDATNVAQITVDAKGRITGVTDVPISGGGGSSGVDVQDEGTPILTPAATLNFTGAGVTVTDAGGGVAEVNIPGGGGGGSGPWEIISTVTISSAVNAINFVGLSGYTDLLILVDDVTKSATANFFVQVSVDNGSTYFGTVGAYEIIATNGGASGATVFQLTAGAGRSAATQAYGMIYGINITGQPKLMQSLDGTKYFVGSASPIDAIRLIVQSPPSTITMNAGTVRLLGKPV